MENNIAEQIKSAIKQGNYTIDVDNTDILRVNINVQCERVPEYIDVKFFANTSEK